MDIITALSMHPHLVRLELLGNRLGTNGCKALATLLRCSATELQQLDLDRNELDDEGIDALVPALINSSHLEILDMSRNSAISSRGWQYLARILESPNVSSLYELSLNYINVDEEAVTALTRSLTNNRKLKCLSFCEVSISTNNKRAFSKLLCDTSNVNSTYLSNHTLTYASKFLGVASLKPLLILNRSNNKKEVAIIKILQNHNDFDMMPFFEWEFKILPLMINWFEKASSITMPSNVQPNIEPRKLSSIYQFVRGMPLLYVEAQLRKQLEDIKSRKSQMEEEKHQMEKRQLEIRHQQLMLDLQLQEFAKREKSMEDEKKSIIEKLGR